MRGSRTTHNDGVLSLKCGNQLEMPGTPDRPEEVIKAIEAGELDESVLDDNVDDLLEIILDTFANGVDKAPESFDVDEHHEFAKKCAEESAVLLKNDGVLPLDSNKKVAFIGDFLYLPRYQGAGSSIVNPTKLDNTADLLKKCNISPMLTYPLGKSLRGLHQLWIYALFSFGHIPSSRIISS